jgi:uncharacterized protein
MAAWGGEARIDPRGSPVSTLKGMRRHTITLIIVALAALVLALWPWMTGHEDPPEPEPEPPVPELEDYPRGSAIDWQEWGPEVRALAADRGQGLFLYFHGQWCTWCRQYQDETLEQPRTVAAIEEGFVPVLVNMDQRRDLFTRLGGRGVPFTVLLDSQGELLARFTGHVAADDLQGLLTEASAQLTTAASVPEGLEALLDAEPERFLAFLEETYDPDVHRLSRASVVGTLSKRPQPMTYRALLHEPGWSARIDAMLDVLRADLYDPVDGGFFFFFDPDQPNPETQVETSKVLGLNALLAWLFADASEVLGREADARTVRGALGYLRTHLWDVEQDAFWGSQYSDPDYYSLPADRRADRVPPPVERVQYADVSGQAIVALVRAARALDEPEYLEWAAEALGGLDRHLGHPDGGYYHFRPDGGRARLQGYLPAQVWPAAAWWVYFEATGDEQAALRGAELLSHIAAYRLPGLGGFAERLDPDLEPWTDSRTHGALAWLLTGPARAAQVPEEILPADRRARWVAEALTRLELGSAGDPDDMALGVLARRRLEGAS